MAEQSHIQLHHVMTISCPFFGREEPAGCSARLGRIHKSNEPRVIGKGDIFRRIRVGRLLGRLSGRGVSPTARYIVPPPSHHDPRLLRTGATLASANSERLLRTLNSQTIASPNVPLAPVGGLPSTRSFCSASREDVEALQGNVLAARRNQTPPTAFRASSRPTFHKFQQIILWHQGRPHACSSNLPPDEPFTTSTACPWRSKDGRSEA